jgi:Acetokinase family
LVAVGTEPASLSYAIVRSAYMQAASSKARSPRTCRSCNRPSSNPAVAAEHRRRGDRIAALFAAIVCRLVRPGEARIRHRRKLGAQKARPCVRARAPRPRGSQNSPTIRVRIAEKLAWLGAVLDPAANSAGESLISRPESRVAVLVVPTDEELMIAQHTLAFLPKGTAKSTHAARDAAAMTRD